MLRSPFEPCIPTRHAKVPTGPDWIHEIKHDGYRLIVQRDGDCVRLFTRNGHDWSARYPRIVEAALRLRATSYVIDGEAVLLGADGVSDFEGLHSRKHDASVQLYAFDVLVADGEQLLLTDVQLQSARANLLPDQGISTPQTAGRLMKVGKLNVNAQFGETEASRWATGPMRDLRKPPLSLRKTNLARLLARRVDGIHLAPFEQGEVGPELFRHACKLGL
ncbi:DNA ligase [Bradyrhizobium sp. Arg816]|uniref:ATP-dependent DNA ligase n=1 Tax=Bradyrhizobium sp. Arg816 TaxID=2998491 RepID=UPI00249DF47F|nr:DNA ligase [Bradyrhizobium sp. Arg816]MDI3560010.1 DNA ligase [Bradyrhizobium sp. Arg816]